jgi:hypothetical protein
MAITWLSIPQTPAQNNWQAAGALFVALKIKYDPTHLFHLNQNIKPTNWGERLRLATGGPAAPHLPAKRALPLPACGLLAGRGFEPFHKLFHRCEVTHINDGSRFDTHQIHGPAQRSEPSASNPRTLF